MAFIKFLLYFTSDFCFLSCLHCVDVGRMWIYCNTDSVCLLLSQDAIIKVHVDLVV